MGRRETIAHQDYTIEVAVVVLVGYPSLSREIVLERDQMVVGKVQHLIASIVETVNRAVAVAAHKGKIVVVASTWTWKKKLLEINEG